MRSTKPFNDLSCLRKVCEDWIGSGQLPRKCEMCVWALNGTVARWLLCVKHDGEQVETVL